MKQISSLSLSKRNLVFLTGFYFLWGICLWLSIARYGLGVSSDSVAYMFAGKNLFAGQGLTTYTDAPFAAWPPFYPVILGLVHKLTGLNMLYAATLIQFLTYILACVVITSLLLNIFNGRAFYVLSGSVMVSIGSVIIITFQLVSTDYIHLVLVLTYLLFLSQYARTQNPIYIGWMILFGGMAALTRYIGLAVIITGIILTFFYTRETPVRRITRALLTSLAALPAGAWILVERFFYQLPRREPILFSRSVAQYSGAIMEWFTASEIGEAIPRHVWLLWGLVAGLVILLLIRTRNQPVLSPEAVSILVYGFVYTVLLLGIASQTYFNRLIGRFVQPVFPVLIVLGLLVADKVFNYASNRFSKSLSTAVKLMATVVMVLVVLPIGIESFETIKETALNGVGYENIYNSKAWNENQIIRHIKTSPFQEKSLLFSNYQAGIAFHTWHTVYPSPRKFSNPYSDELISLESYQAGLFEIDTPTYIIWIEPNTYEHVYEVEELAEIGAIIPIIVDDEHGGIYQIISK